MNQPVVHHQTVMLQAICKEFLETGKFPAHINGEEGLRDTRILMSIYEAAKTGKRISLVWGSVDLFYEYNILVHDPSIKKNPGNKYEAYPDNRLKRNDW